MQNKKSLQKLIDYFRNFTFDPFHTKVQPKNKCKSCLQENTNQTDNKECVEQLYNSVLNARKMALQFQDRMHELLMEIDRLEEVIEGLREEMKDEKQDWEKMMQESRNIIQVLRAELIDKDDLRRHLFEKQQQNKFLIEQLSHIENQLQLTQQQVRKYQIEAANNFELKQPINFRQLQNYEQQIRAINQNLQLSNQSNQSLIHTIAELQNQIRLLTQNTNSHQNHLLPPYPQQSIASQEQQNPLLQHQIHPYSSTQLIHLSHISFQNQLIDLHSQQQHDIHSSSVLKDLLNTLQQHHRESKQQNHNELTQQHHNELTQQHHRELKQQHHRELKQQHHRELKQQHHKEVNFIYHSDQNTRSNLIPKPHRSQKQNIYNEANQQQTQVKQKTFTISSSQRSQAKKKAKINEEKNIPGNKKQLKLLTQYSIKVDELQQFEGIDINENKNEYISCDGCVDKEEPRNEKNSGQMCSDPYYCFFVLTGQCIKINSSHLEEIARVDVGDIWEEVIERRVPMNEWNDYLHSTIYQRAGLIYHHN